MIVKLSEAETDRIILNGVGRSDNVRRDWRTIRTPTRSGDQADAEKFKASFIPPLAKTNGQSKNQAPFKTDFRGGAISLQEPKGLTAAQGSFPAAVLLKYLFRCFPRLWQ